MSLKRLHLWQCEKLVEVLRDQPELEELRLGRNCFCVELLENTDVPKLRSLSSGLKDAAYLVPGRPIERLELDTPFSSQNFNLRLFQKLSLSTKPITYVSVTIYNSWEDGVVRAAIRAFAGNWPDTERLRINVDGPITGQTILDEIPAFQSIRELGFVSASLTTAEEPASTNPVHNYGIVQRGYLKDWEQIFSHLKELCPTLVKTWHTPYIGAYGRGWDS
ncbi:hypothetical protein FRC01_004360 [Tulasnella sp. 417]|nr:hypothetical protein FRC01_004360 [Tulasnella sp. 417]